MKILFVCSRNRWRSRTAEELFKNHPLHQVRSAGTEQTARIKISSKLIEWADLIFAMEKKHKERMLEQFEDTIQNKKVIILNIPDEYAFMDPELIESIQESTAPYL